ncbi:glycoside hydrolase family 26 protein [Geodermatophilus sp. SYSU D01106]
MAAWVVSPGGAESAEAVAGSGATPSDPLPKEDAEAPCASAVASVVTPAADAVLRSGRVPLVALLSEPAKSARWTLARADGGRRWIDDGYFFAVSPDRGGAFSVSLDLGVGSYTFRVEAVDTAASGCTSDEVTFSVSDEVAGAGWISGASGEGVATGQFSSWRGTPVSIAGTWVDSNAGQVALWTMQPGAEFADWDGDLDVAVGAIGAHETWAAAARGEYDQRWETSLRSMARLREGRTGTVYIRFAHEMNGDWYPWSVTPETSGDFIAAWQRFRALQQEWFPAARLVFAPNDRSAGDVDWRTLFPGSRYVDVVSMSYFNHYVQSADVAGFWARATSRDHMGAPTGIQGFSDFARSVGLPFAVSEWGPHAAFGDGRAYVEQMYQWFRANAGTGPGQLLYEVLFNVERDGNAFAVFPTSNVPLAAEAYQRLW